MGRNPCHHYRHTRGRLLFLGEAFISAISISKKVKTLGGRMKDGKFYMYGNRRNSNVINVHLSQALPFFDTKKVNKKMIDSTSNCYCN